MAAKKKDLVVLVQTSDFTTGLYTASKAIKDYELFINFPDQTWSYREWQDNQIGSSRNSLDKRGHESRYGVLGVYDRTKISHLKDLILAHESAVKSGAIDWD